MRLVAKLTMMISIILLMALLAACEGGVLVGDGRELGETPSNPCETEWRRTPKTWQDSGDALRTAGLLPFDCEQPEAMSGFCKGDFSVLVVSWVDGRNWIYALGPQDLVGIDTPTCKMGVGLAGCFLWVGTPQPWCRP